MTAPDPVTVTFPVTITVHPAAYAAEYGETLRGTPESFAEDELEGLIEQLPKRMKPILQFHVGRPQPTSRERYAALGAELLTTTQEYIESLLPAADYAAATGVVYAAQEFDDGWLILPGAATVYFLGDRTPIDLGFVPVLSRRPVSDRLERLLTEYSGGPRGPQAAISVDLMTGEVQYDAHGEATLRGKFRELGGGPR